MSESAVVTAPTAPAGEAPVSEFNQVVWQEEPAAAPVIAEPAAVTEPTPEPTNPDINILTLENGDKEVRLATGEVYRGKTDAEIINNIAKGKIEASRHIQTLKLQQQATPAIDPNAAPVDASAQALLDLIAPGLGAKDGKTLAETLQAQQQIVQQYRDQQTAAAFFQSVPDFPRTPENTEKLGAFMDSKGMTFTLDNAIMAHYTLKGMGEYAAVPPPVPRAADGKFAPRVQNTMPMPPQGSQAPIEAPKDIWSMSRDEFDKYRAQMGAQTA